MSNTKERFCTKCKTKLKKLIGKGNGIVFKGSGFYCKDYPKNKKDKNGNTFKKEN